MAPLETEKSEATLRCTVQEYFGEWGWVTDSDTTYNHTQKFQTINLKFLTHCSHYNTLVLWIQAVNKILSCFHFR